MIPPIRTDETTGLKLFNTRAAKASEKIAGKGYSPVADEALTTLPPPRAIDCGPRLGCEMAHLGRAGCAAPRLRRQRR